jgi:phosphoribosylglycinamide formyltransferase-1
MVGNNSRAFAFERARANGIPALHIPPSRFPTEAEYAERLSSVLSDARVELITLAGYMKKLPPRVVAEYRNRIINIHPALLPAFGGQGMYGSNVHRAVIEYGAKISGVTVHFVDDEYDHGPVILQKAVPVLDDDDDQALAARVLRAEHEYYWQAVEAVAAGRVNVAGRRVIWC